MAYPQVKPQPVMTLEEFLAWEARQEIRHEFVDGVAYAMVGGTAAHNRIQANIVMAAGAKLRGGKCEAYTCGMKVLTGNGRARYPDASIDCTGIADSAVGLSAPTVVFEVVSDDSQRRDRAEKLSDYNSTPSIRHYVILEQSQPLADIYSRGTHGDFALHPVTVEGLDGAIELPAVGLSLTMGEAYDRVRFGETQGDQTEAETAG